MDRQQQILSAKSRQLLKDYEDIIKEAINEIEKELHRDSKVLPPTEFEILKKTIKNHYYLEGAQRILAVINKFASYE